MRKAYLFILIWCVWTVFSTDGARAQRPAASPSTVHGTVVSATGSPVVLSDAEYAVVTSPLPHKPRQLNGNGVTIENVSSRVIRVVNLRFAWRGTYGLQVMVAVHNLRVGEIREYRGKDLDMILQSDPSEMTLNVMPTGAEFEDRSHWAAPRNQWSPTEMYCLHQSGSNLLARKWEVTDGSYSISFDVADPKIVAYRLGAIKDAPNNFQITLGRWVELSEVERDARGSFVDSDRSLSAQISSKDVGGKASPNVKATIEPGTAIFVAALRFIDGRVWNQDTRRQELLWDN